MDDYKVFIDSYQNPYPKNLLEDSELEFLMNRKLIKIYGSGFKTNFVGEIITPNNKYFSLPKRFPNTIENINLFKDVLNKFSTIKSEKLIENDIFIMSKNGIESEKYYFNELKNFFLDYLTYEFIYPKDRIYKHSPSPIQGGKIDILKTDRFRKQKGFGVTYKVKDINNWKLQNIYWSTIKELSDKYGHDSDIKEMFDFLTSDGFIIEEIDISDNDKIIEDIENSDVGIIHLPIKEVLLSYFKSKKIESDKYKINVFYTDNFAYVWEEMVRLSLKENNKFRKDLEDKFKTVDISDVWFSSELEIDNFLKENRKFQKISIEQRGKGFILSFKRDKISIPDVFSLFNDRRIIGDAKYYNKPEESEFEKEYVTYNYLCKNEYPMIVLSPALRTKPVMAKRKDLDGVDYELVIFDLSIEEVIKDAVNGTNRTIGKVHGFLFDKGWTKRNFF
jgi:hypothetical protein